VAQCRAQSGLEAKVLPWTALVPRALNRSGTSPFAIPAAQASVAAWPPTVGSAHLTLAFHGAARQQAQRKAARWNKSSSSVASAKYLLTGAISAPLRVILAMVWTWGVETSCDTTSQPTGRRARMSRLRG
jgi:hypothetical protein